MQIIWPLSTFEQNCMILCFIWTMSDLGNGFSLHNNNLLTVKWETLVKRSNLGPNTWNKMYLFKQKENYKDTITGI